MRKPVVNEDEIKQALSQAGEYPVILTPTQLAKLLGLKVKTIYHWIAAGRLDGAYRKRGKHNLIWRDRAIHIILNGPEWK